MADRALDPTERSAVMSHLADCALCRDEVRAIRRLGAARRWRRGVTWGVPAVAAAALVLFVLNPSATPVGETPSPPAIRNAAGSAGLMAVSPADGADVAGQQIEFRWRGDATAAPFVLVVSTLEGETVFSTATEDLMVELPLDSLTVGQTYLWYVDGVMRDTVRASTGIHRFTVRP